MGVRERIRRYRTTGAAADLIRVEVLVPKESRGEILSLAERLRNEYRCKKPVRSVNAEVVNDRAKLMIHRLLARRMASEPDLVAQARDVLSSRRVGGASPEYIDEWKQLLALEPNELRRIITARTDDMYRLRVSSPLALVADIENPDLRRRVWRKARQGLNLHGA